MEACKNFPIRVFDKMKSANDTGARQKRMNAMLEKKI
jgi:hypothetical protein